jgi:hypothetical protein
VWLYLSYFYTSSGRQLADVMLRELFSAQSRHLLSSVAMRDSVRLIALYIVLAESFARD